MTDMLTIVPKDILGVILEYLEDADIPALFVCCKWIQGSGCITLCHMVDQQLPKVAQYIEYYFTGRGYRTATRCHPLHGRVRVGFSLLAVQCEFDIIRSAASGLIIVTYQAVYNQDIYILSAKGGYAGERLLSINHVNTHPDWVSRCTAFRLRQPRQPVHEVIESISAGSIYKLIATLDIETLCRIGSALDLHEVTLGNLGSQYHHAHIQETIAQILDR